MTVSGGISASTLIALVALIGTLTAYCAAFYLIRRRPNSSSLVAPAGIEALDDDRSCFRATLRMAAAALAELAPTNEVEAAQGAIRLLLDTPSLAIAEVIDERRLLQIEASTDANVVWIVSPAEAIEFGYPDAVSFTDTVLANLGRGIQYRYIVADSVDTRVRARRILEAVKQRGFEEKFAVRFIDSTYWAHPSQRVSEIVLYGGAPPTLYIRFPGYGAIPPRWVRGAVDSARARQSDLAMLWETAASLEPAEERT